MKSLTMHGMIAAGPILQFVPRAADPPFLPRKTQINQKTPRNREDCRPLADQNAPFLSAKAALGSETAPKTPFLGGRALTFTGGRTARMPDGILPGEMKDTESLNIESPSAKKLHVDVDRARMAFQTGQVAVAEASFSIREGEFVAIVGPSGCGKSTLLRMIAGLIAPTQGRVTIAGRPAVETRSTGRTGFVFQEPRLLPWRTAAQNVGLPLELERRPRSIREARVPEALALVGLTPADAGKTPRMLSGGMRMRVSLARALITNPGLLLLDEPFGALDDILRQQLNAELVRIWMQRRPTTVFVTHNVAEAVYLSQRVLVVTRSPGRIAADVPIPFAYPRETGLRATGEFARLTGEISDRLRESAL
jgi:NitT/TauT family transport system ATP-binding protein